jgi:hypothetical protein
MKTKVKNSVAACTLFNYELRASQRGEVPERISNYLVNPKQLRYI